MGGSDTESSPPPLRPPHTPVTVLDTHQSGVLGSHAGSLHQQLLVSQLHTVQPSDGLERDPPADHVYPRNSKQQLRGPQPSLTVCGAYLVVEVDVNVFAEGVAFRQACGAVFHQVEGLQGPE